MTPTRAAVALILVICLGACGLLPPADGISAEQAATAALGAVPLPAGDVWHVNEAEAGPLEQLMPDRGGLDWARDLPTHRWVWQVSLESQDRGEQARVIIDFVDGTVYGYVLSLVHR